MTSVKYRMFEKLVASKRTREHLKNRNPSARSAPAKPKNSSKVLVENRNIEGFDCYRFRHREKSGRYGVLYLYGGGFINPASKADFEICRGIVENTSAEVWALMYPLFPEYTMAETVKIALAGYLSLREKFDRVLVFGFSSGACLALYLCEYIRHENLGFPIPDRLILNSPLLQLPPSESQMRMINELDKLDLCIPKEFFYPEGLTGMMIEAEAEDNRYLSRVLDSDLTGFPEIHLFYGTNECASAYLNDMKRCCAKYSVPLYVYMFEGMMHCWGLRDMYPEGTETQQIYFSLLDRE